MPAGHTKSVADVEDVAQRDEAGINLTAVLFTLNTWNTLGLWGQGSLDH